jgi:hypothetical protein
MTTIVIEDTACYPEIGQLFSRMAPIHLNLNSKADLLYNRAKALRCQSSVTQAGSIC